MNKELPISAAWLCTWFSFYSEGDTLHGARNRETNFALQCKTKNGLWQKDNGVIHWNHLANEAKNAR